MVASLRAPGGICCGLICTRWRPFVLQILLDSAVAHLGPAPTRLVLRKYWTGLAAALLVPLRLMRSSSRSGYSSSFWLGFSLLIAAPGADAQVAPPSSDLRP